MNQRRKKNSSKVNLIISVAVHSLLLGAAFFFAARQGMLGKKLRQITVTLAPKEKKPQAPKPKAAAPKPAAPRLAAVPKPAAAPAKKLAESEPPPAAPQAALPAAAPPPATLPAFEFNDGAKDVQTTTDANVIYKGLIEDALRSRWKRPDDIQDDHYTAEIQLEIDRDGRVTGYQWLKGSGDLRWDNSVKRALAQTQAISRPPPKGFPEKFQVRFDVQTGTDPLQLSSR